MEPDAEPSSGKLSLRGKTGLLAAIAVVVVLLVGLPAYRWFFLISVGIGIVIAGGLALWYKLRPIRETDVQNTKKPLGLE